MKGGRESKNALLARQNVLPSKGIGHELGARSWPEREKVQQGGKTAMENSRGNMY